MTSITINSSSLPQGVGSSSSDVPHGYNIYFDSNKVVGT